MYISQRKMLFAVIFILSGLFIIGVIDRLAIHRVHSNNIQNYSENYKINKKWIGIGVSQDKGNSNQKFLKVIDVIPDSPAMKAGIKPGDIIADVNGKKIINEYDLKNAILKTPVGDKITIGIFRGGQNNQISITISSIPHYNK